MLQVHPLIDAVPLGGCGIGSERRQKIEKRVWKSLLRAAASQDEEITTQDPANRFLSLLGAALASGRAHVAGRDGKAPQINPEAWGWHQEAAEQDREARSWPQGKRVGWLDGRDLYLDPEASFAEVQRLGEEQGERLAVSRVQLHKRLKERGLLVSVEAGKLITRRKLQGTNRAVLYLRAGDLTSQKPGEPGGRRGKRKASRACARSASGHTPGKNGKAGAAP